MEALNMRFPSETLKDALIILGYPDLANTDESRALGDIADEAVLKGPLTCSPKVAMASCYYLLQIRLWANKDNLRSVARAFDCSEPPIRDAIRKLRPYFDAKMKKGWKP
jgi:hypothetical protein